MIFSPLSSFFCCCCLTEVIDVDIFHPEQNREFQVFEFTDVNEGGILHNGFEIVIEGDLRDIFEGKYNAYLYSDNEIMVHMPSMSHAFLHESEMLIKKQKAHDTHCSRTQESHDVARNKILKDERRQTKRLLLRFPQDMELSNNVYSPQSSDDGEIEIETLPFKSEFEAGGHKVTTVTVRISWKVSIVEEEKRVVKSSTDSNKAAAKLTERLSGMEL